MMGRKRTQAIVAGRWEIRSTTVAAAAAGSGSSNSSSDGGSSRAGSCSGIALKQQPPRQQCLQSCLGSCDRMAMYPPEANVAVFMCIRFCAPWFVSWWEGGFRPFR